MIPQLRALLSPESGGRAPGVHAILYLIVFLDEIAFTLLIVAMPLIRDELRLDYLQVGLLLGLPLVVSTLAEPVVLLLGDTPWRRRALLVGGAVLGGALLLIATAPAYPALLAAVALSYPASGAFVGLSQVELVGRQSGRESEAMSRWTAAGTIGNLLGPSALALTLALDGSWRSPLFACALAAVLLTVAVRRRLRPGGSAALPPPRAIVAQMVGNLRAVAARLSIWRWLALLLLADLMLDVFFGYLALYLVDAAGIAPVTAALGTTLWLLGFLAGQVALPRLLRRFDGRSIIRVTAGATLFAYPAWLLAVRAPGLRLAGLAALGLLSSPWYPVLKGESYAAARGKAGSVAALESFTGVFGGALAMVIGAAAARYGLTAALLALAAGPLALVALTPPADRIHPA